MKKYRVLVCGTSFGRFYIEGIKKLSEQYELAGIFSKGSEQSGRLAEKLGVPLYTDLNEINRDKIDVACVVVRSQIVGGKGTEIAETLLPKGIHVIQEQPVHMADMMKCYQAAKKGGCQYFVETFYPYLSATETFLSTAKKVLSQTTPVYIEAACSLQVLFPLLDVLGRMLGGFTPWQLSADSVQENGLFSRITGSLRGIPWELKVQNELDSENPDNYFYLLHRITLYTESGSLALTESHGEVVWSPRYLIPRDENHVLDPYQDEQLLQLPLSEALLPCGNMTIKKMYEEEWPDTICRYLTITYHQLEKNRADPALQQQNLMAAKIWNEIGRILGSSRQVKMHDFQLLTLRQLEKQECGV